MYNQFVNLSKILIHKVSGGAHWKDTIHCMNLLVKLFNEIMNIEEKAIITEEFKDISNNDMHIIEAIGLDEPRSMSSVAKDLSVTVGTLTIAINNLVKRHM